jgi:hypothetical protein
MVAIILSEDDAFYRSVAHRSRLHKYNVIRYRDPVKLADNLAELKPELIIIRGVDFPRHWEVIASQLLCTRNYSSTRIVLFLALGTSTSFSWPNVSVLYEPAERGSGSLLSEEAAKEFSVLISPGKSPKQGHESLSASSTLALTASQVTGLSASRLIRAASKSSSIKVNNI